VTAARHVSCGPTGVRAPAGTRGRARAGSGAGFTLIELLVVLVLIGILSTFALTALFNAVYRARLSGLALEAASVCQAARLEAVKRSAPVRVEVHFSTNSLISYVDLDTTSPGVYKAGGPDILLSTIILPNGVFLHGPGAMGTANLNAVYDFTALSDGAAVQFNADGAVDNMGAFRFRDQRGNILELRVSPKASARVAVRKFAGDPNGGDDPTQYFESGEGTGWTWY